jgi:hypothetical protein
MRQALVGGLIGALGSSFVVKRVKELKMFYASSGKYDNVVIAVCVDQSCTVNHVDVNGNTYSNMQLHANDLILGGSVTVVSGNMFIMTADVAGVI